MSTELSSTPETDKAIGKWNPELHEVVTAFFARNLERQRDTARRLLERCRHVNGLPYELYHDIQEALNCDAHAELKAAIADGKVIQQVGHGSGEWFDCGAKPAWTRPPECYRVKPEGQE